MAFPGSLPAPLVAAALLCGSGIGACGADDQRAEDETVLGTRPPEWTFTDWTGVRRDGAADDGSRGDEATGPASGWTGRLADLRGKVVLVRWWTAPGCPYCHATAPALNTFHERFAEKGLQVVGAYHHKSTAPLDPRKVAGWAEDFGFRFPVAIDRDWKTLDSWWLSRQKRAWTSVTFLLDRNGSVRFVHPGGQYVKGDGEYEKLEREIRRLLDEPAAGPDPGG